MLELTELNSWRNKLAEGQRAFEQADYPLAEALLIAAFQMAPTEPVVNEALGRTKWRLGKLEDAEILLSWAARHGMGEIFIELSQLAGEQNKYKQALRWLDESVQLSGHSTAERLQRARILMRTGEIDQAVRLAERANQDTPEGDVHENAVRKVLARALNHSGIDMCHQDRYEESLFTFRRAQWLDPSWSCPHVNMGAVFATLEKPSKARECYDRALLIDGDNAVAHYNLGLWYLDHDKVSSARVSFLRAIESDPDNADAWVQLGYCHQPHNPEKAKECWETALAIQPGHAEALKCLGRASRASASLA